MIWHCKIFWKRHFIYSLRTHTFGDGLSSSITRWKNTKYDLLNRRFYCDRKCQRCKDQPYVVARTPLSSLVHAVRISEPWGNWKGVFIFTRQFCSKAAKKLVKQQNASIGSKPQLSEVNRLLSLAKPEKWRLTGAVVLLLISSSVTMAVPFCLGKVIDVIYTTNPEQMRENLNTLSLVLVGVFLIGGLCNFGRVYLMSISGQRITQALRTKVFSSIMRQEVGFFDRNKTGELINRLSTDTSLVSHSVTMNISDGLRSSVMVLAGVSMMFYMSPQLALVGLAIVPPMAGLAVIYGRFIKKITRSVQDSLAEATHVAEERISNVRTVKSFCREGHEMVFYEKKTLEILHLAYKEALARGVFFGMTGMGGNLMILSVLYYGGGMVTEESLTVGQLSSFLMYAAYVGISVAGLSSFYSEAMRGLGASTRLWQLIDRHPEIPLSGGWIPDGPPVGNICFKDVWFSYPTRSEPVLRGLNLELKAGKSTAVVGPSGSGKSTLAALLLRLYDPDRGWVTLDGVSVADINPLWLKHFMASVSQEPVLFSGSIRENILYGVGPNGIQDMDLGLLSNGVTDAQMQERLINAAKEANALDFIMKLPEKFDTHVGERGIMLSGGQKQRVAIARAIIKDPKILLLDEATSALDSESEHLVQEALERVMKGRTVLTIAHRLSTIRKSDAIAVLDNGKIEEKGSYEELMSLEDGAFKKLVKHQSFFEESDK